MWHIQIISTTQQDKMTYTKTSSELIEDYPTLHTNDVAKCMDTFLISLNFIQIVDILSFSVTKFINLLDKIIRIQNLQIK